MLNLKLNPRSHIPADCAVFFRSRERHGQLSNMTHAFPLTVNAVTFQGPEGLYQALKFPHDPDFQRLIGAQRSGMEAKHIAYTRKDTAPTWDSFRGDAMAFTLALKLLQHPDAFGAALIDTAPSPSSNAPAATPGGAHRPTTTAPSPDTTSSDRSSPNSGTTSPSSKTPNAPPVSSSPTPIPPSSPSPTNQPYPAKARPKNPSNYRAPLTQPDRKHWQRPGRKAHRISTLTRRMPAAIPPSRTALGTPSDLTTAPRAPPASPLNHPAGRRPSPLRSH